MRLDIILKVAVVLVVPRLEIGVFGTNIGVLANENAYIRAQT
jgi:hypothetical protein